MVVIHYWLSNRPRASIVRTQSGRSMRSQTDKIASKSCFLFVLRHFIINSDFINEKRASMTAR